MAYPFSKIEKKWSKRWFETKIYEPDLKRAKRPFYNLMMFPYPSAEGLHVGNMYAFTGSDIYGRFHRMQGDDVFEPIGLDGFGIHSENYALKIGTHPMKQAKISEKRFYDQLKIIGNGFAWQERLETYDPEYYKWTQWIFVQMWKRGLAYRQKASVNWCPSCKTVLADEQVINGKCERCGTEAIKKDLEQWFFKITKYADRLLKNLDKIDWSERVKIAQRNWIGKSEGALIKFLISNSQFSIEVFTTRPDTIYGATYMVLAPEHKLIEDLKHQITNYKEVEKYIKKAKAKTENERITEGGRKTGVELRGIKAINPATKKTISIWASDYVLASYGTGAIMAVPAYDERDLEFAKEFKLPVVKAKLVDKDKIIKKIGGKKTVQYHLRDWLISRQRYWGPPIPIIYCRKCWERMDQKKRKSLRYGIDYATFDNEEFVIHPVPEKDLPVKLPYIKDFQPTGSTYAGPLASQKKFYEVRCPKCKSSAYRETDVSDTFLDSAWYFFRYPDVKNKREPFDKLRVKKWLPVNRYIGGAEHSVLHLLYSRFLTMVFKDMKLIGFDEPFSQFRAHGLLISSGAKMSKSKGNVVVPDVYIKKYGADTTRLYLMFLGPYEQGGDWRDAGIIGIVRFLNRVWALASNVSNNSNISSWLHPHIKEVTEDIANLKYNTAIAELMTALNKLEKETLRPVRQAHGEQAQGKKINRKDFETFLLLLAPFAPFITEELWQKLGNRYSIHREPWPKYDKRHLKAKTFSLIIQINGKVRGQVEARRGTNEAEAKKLALAEEKVRKALGVGKIKRTIFVKDRLINFVI